MSFNSTTIISFLDALSRHEGDLFYVIEKAAVDAFPDQFIRTPFGVAVRGGSTIPVRRVLELLAIPDADAEVLFNHLPDDPVVLAAYLRPRLLGGDG